jgi:rhamnosyltransferase
MPLEIAAIATAFFPDERLAAVVEAALKSCGQVIVVDNTPAGEESSAGELAELLGVQVLRSGENLGLAAALNLGVRQLTPQVEAVLFLDQDSVLSTELVEGLTGHLLNDPGIGIAAPAPFDVDRGKYYETRAFLHATVKDMPVVITSGMLVRREVIEKVGQFREDFFVDHVDNDFCLRARAAGYRIIRDKRLKLEHSLGKREEHSVAGVSVTASRHPTWRLYWIARNAMVLVREHWRAEPGWAFSTLFYMCVWLGTRTVFEPPRLERAKVALRGYADGLRGRTDLRFLPPGASLRTAAGAGRAK